MPCGRCGWEGGGGPSEQRARRGPTPSRKARGHAQKEKIITLTPILFRGGVETKSILWRYYFCIFAATFRRPVEDQKRTAQAMLGSFTKLVSRLFGDKQQRDIKKLRPLVAAINAEYEKLHGLTDQQLRERSADFRRRIQEHLRDIDAEIAAVTKRARDEQTPPDEKEALYEKLDALKKTRDDKIEEALDAILPEAFAVVKETARRLTEAGKLTAAATERDRELAAAGKDFLTIEGDTVTYHDTWTVAGTKQTWKMVHYDVQLMGGIVLHQGKIAEMATGEGKTLVSTLPSYLNALAGEGVHIVTVNDYLARRDAEWNGPILEFLGVTVDCLEYYKPHSEGRKKAYRADVTYGTNNEFGFDYLRDNMAVRPEDRVQRKLHYAIVDEIDSVLIDDARTPLIISGPVEGAEKDHERFYELKPRVEKLIKAQREYVNKAVAVARKAWQEKGAAQKETEEGAMMLLRAARGMPKHKQLMKLLQEPGVKAFLQKVENYYLQEQGKEMPKIDQELYFVIDEKNNSVELTDKGVELITGAGEDPAFFIVPDVGSRLVEIEKSDLSDEEKRKAKEALLREFSEKTERIHTIQQLLKAYTLFERDVEYVIMDGQVKIVDEQTGRIMEGRRYSDGLHQAIEAKENVKVQAATQTYATITLQNYFRMYHKLAGMTGTAETEANEFWEIYKLEVVVIPTHKPVIREDKEDLIFRTKREKYAAVIDEIEKLRAQGRPVLVGTTSVEVSELLSRMLKRKKIPHNVLNAKHHQREAEIVAQAGQAGAVTIATNMAGRGTDIKLGPGVKEAGGLAIIGTERHDSRRIDRQLRGRAGRQGDPGSSQFFISLEDDLMRLFGSDRIARLLDRLGYEEGEPLQHSMITRSIERAQKKVEENNFGIRKRLLEYDDVMNSQREVIYKRRSNALLGQKLEIDFIHSLQDYLAQIVEQYHPAQDYDGLRMELLLTLGMEPPFSADEFARLDASEAERRLFEAAWQHYQQKKQALIAQTLPVFQRVLEDEGEKFRNVVLPFTNGKYVLQVIAPLREAVESNGEAIIRAVLKTASLAVIDDIWKEHLRRLDELRQSVQAAVYEQKDPLLIYKFESFKLFQESLGRINKEILSWIFKGFIPVEQPPTTTTAPPPPKRKPRNLKTSRQSLIPTQPVAPPNAPPNGQPAGEAPRQPQTFKREGKKVGRNDPCPCGSGKKYKHCHGKTVKS